MAQAGMVWVPVVPSMRGFDTKVSAYVKKLSNAKVRVDPVIDTAQWRGEVTAAAAAVSPIHVGIDLDTGEAAAQLGRFAGQAYAEVGQVPSNVNVDTAEASGRLEAFAGTAYAEVGEIPSNVNVDTTEATAHVDAFEADAKRTLETITANVNVDTGEATAHVEAFEADAKRRLETITANVDVDTGEASAHVDAFEADTKRKLETVTANIDVDTGHATERVDAFEAETKRKLESTTANINVDTGRATEKVDAFEAETKRKLETTTANIDVDTGRATEKVDAFEANTKRKLETITANVDADTGRATEKVDMFDLRSRQKLNNIPANINADTGAATDEVEMFDGISRARLHNIPANINVDSKTAIGQLDWFNTDGRLHLNKPPITANIDADTGRATQKTDTFWQRTKDRLRTITANVDADTGKASAKVDSFWARSKAHLNNITANINADTGRATARIHVWKAEMNRYVNNPITAFPVVNTSVATGQLVAWKAMAQGLVGTIHSTLTLDVGGVLGGIQQIISGLFQAYTGVLAFAEAWGVAFVAVAGVIALIGSLGPLVFALVGGLATIPALAVGAGFAIGTLLIGTRGVAEALTNAFDPTKASEFQAALAKLSPQARDTMRALQGLSGVLDLHKLQTDVQDALFFHLADVVKQLGTAYIPLARNGFISMATSINAAVRSFAGFLLMPNVLERMREAEDSVTRGFAIFTSGLETWGEALTTLAAVGSRQLPRIAGGIAEVGREFNAYINEVASSGELDAFLTRSIDELGVLIHLVGSLGRITISIFEAAGTSGVDLVRMLDQGATAFADWLDTAEGFERIRDLFEASYQTMRNIAPLFDALGAALAGPGLDTFIEYAPQIGQAFGDLAGIIPGLAVGFADVTAGVNSVLHAETPLLYALVYGLGPAFLDLINMVVALTNAISGGLTAAIWALQGPINFIAGLMRGVTGWANSLGFSGGGVVVEHRAAGGVIPGYEPGKDTVLALLSRGEGVLVPEAVRGLGPEFIGWANRHYSRGRSSGGIGTGLGFADGGVLLKQTIPAPGAESVAAMAPSLSGLRRGGIGAAPPGDYGAASQGGVTQVNHFNVPLDEQAFAAATLRRLDFAQRVAG